LADFFVLAAEAAMTFTRELYLNATSPDRGAVDFKSQFQYGRTTNKTCPNNQHLPNPSVACQDVERVFVVNMGLSWRSAAALSGVHTLGKAQPQNSGFNGWWSDNINSRYFNNNYYISMYFKGWIPEQVTSSGKWQWGMSNENRNDTLYGHQMMLDSDLCLAYSARFGTSGYKEQTAAEKPKACAWTLPGLSEVPGEQMSLIDGMDKYNNGKFCGENASQLWRMLPGGTSLDNRTSRWKIFDELPYVVSQDTRAVRIFGAIRAACCNGCKSFDKPECDAQAIEDGFQGGVKKDFGVVSHPSGMAKFNVMEFINDEHVWIDAFLHAWKLATQNGRHGLTFLMSQPPSPAPTPLPCRAGFCQSNTRSWAEKCEMKAYCAGCSFCNR